MSSYKEKIVLRGIPSARMKVIGKSSEIDVEVLENSLDNDDELWFGFFHSNRYDLMDGYFLENETNRWWIIRNGVCSGSFIDSCETLKEAVYLESVWLDVINAIETDSMYRNSAMTPHGPKFIEKYVEFLNGFDSPTKIYNYNNFIYFVKVDINNKLPVLCEFLHFNGDSVELITIWANK